MMRGGNDSLTTTEVAKLASVNASTVKRWADEGLLKYSRTAGGHRRFERRELDKFLRERRSDAADVPAAWVVSLCSGDRYEIDGRLFTARSRLGAWYKVAEELGEALAYMGMQWAEGKISIEQEHVASEALARALTRISDSLPAHGGGPCCVLACVPGDDHTLGLSLAELCLREAGWEVRWLGRNTPLEELERAIRSGGISLVGLSASAAVESPGELAGIVDRLSGVCNKLGIELLLGGRGPWPEPTSFVTRVTDFTSLHQKLVDLRERF